MINIYYAINKDNNIIWVEEGYWNRYHCVNDDEDDSIVDDIATVLNSLYDGHYICHVLNRFGSGYEFGLLVNEQKLIETMKTQGYNFIKNPDLLSHDGIYMFYSFTEDYK